MKEQCRTAELFLPEVLIAPTKTIIKPVTKVTARATVHTPFSLLFVQNYLQDMEKKVKSITVLSSTAVCLSC